MVVRMRATRGHTGNRRSHHALTASALRVCRECNAKVLPHTACGKCGFYDGKTVTNVKEVLAKRLKKQNEKAKALNSV